jgi:hypothetical protein
MGTMISSGTDVVTFLKQQHNQISVGFGAVLSSRGEAVAFAESIAPTRPHPGVESAAANMLVGPFAAMLDRARDAISGKARA